MNTKLLTDVQSPILAIPCYNEEKCIAKVIKDFREEIPSLKIWVFDNASTDQTREIATKLADRVFQVPRKGKGFVIKKMFEEFDGDLLILVDGDDTYFAKDIHALIKPILNGTADITVGNRLHKANRSAFKVSHLFGNLLFLKLLNFFFHAHLKDILSGYRVFSKDFIKQVPITSKGFEIETELTLQAIENNFKIQEIDISLQNRPEGSHSKINKYRDGYQILMTIIALLRDHHPLRFFSFFAILSFIGFGLSLFYFFKTEHICFGLISSTLFVSTVILVITGLILNTINVRLFEVKSLLSRK